MKHNKLMLPVLAVIVGVAASAFTRPSSQRDSDLVWFQVNPDGTAVDASAGIQEDDPSQTFGCDTGLVLCARALKISENEVEPNAGGTYSIATGVDITDPQFYDDQTTRQ